MKFLTPFRTVILFVAVSLLGLALVPRLSIDLNPTHSLPSLTVRYAYPDAPPSVVEEAVTSVLENAFSQLQGLKEIESISNYNQGHITLSFGRHEDMDLKRFELAALLRQVYPTLPTTVNYPAISPGQVSTVKAMPLLIYNVNAPLAASHIQKVAAEVLQPRLSQLQGVEQVTVTGAEPLQLSIIFDQERLIRYGLKREEILERVGQESQAVYLGSVTDAKGQRLSVMASNVLESITQLKELPIAYTATGATVLLRDVATVGIEEQEPQRYFRVNGLNTVAVTVYAQPGQNNMQLANDVEKEMAALRQLLPAAFTVQQQYDDTAFLRQELHKVYLRTGLSLLVLVLFVFLLHRDWRYLSVLFSGLVVNLCLGALCAWSLGIGIHLYTLAGVTVSFGLVVDSAIIMLDHLHRRGNRKIFAALVGATLTSLCALLVVYVLPEEQQLNLREFAQIMMAMLAVSLVVAWFYTPAAYKLLSPKQKSKQKGRQHYQKLKKQVWLWQYYGALIQFLTRYRIAFTTTVVLLFGLPVFMLPASVEGWGWYNSSIGSELYQQKVKPYADVALGGALRPFVQEVYDKASFRTPEKTVLHLHATMPHGATLAQMNEAVRTVEQYLASVAGLEQYVTQVQSGQSATLQITFNPVSERAGLPYTLRSQLIARFMNWGGANWQIYGVGRGFSSGAGGSSTPALMAELRGYNYSELERQAEQLAAKLAENARVRDINTNAVALWGEQATEEYVFQFDNAQLNLTKLNSGEVTEALRARAKPMAPAMYLLYQNELMPVSLRERDAEQLSVYQLLHGSFRQEDGKPNMQIGTLGKLSFEKSANTIHKKDRQYIRNLSFTYFGNYKYGAQFLDDVLTQARQEMKPGYTAEATSLFKNVNKEAGKQYGALAVMVLGIFFVCAILFESLRQPFFIMLTVPVSFIGLFLVFSLFGFSFDQGGYAAFILLGGVGVNAAIFIINDLNNLKSTQNSSRAVLKAVTHKALPVCLTVASTVLGLVPFLIDGQQEVFWFSFAVGAIGGFLFSLIAVFVCLPVWLLPQQSR